VIQIRTVATDDKAEAARHGIHVEHLARDKAPLFGVIVVSFCILLQRCWRVELGVKRDRE
jgi:hypothetical protein